MESTTERVKGEEEGIGDAMVDTQRADIRKQFIGSLSWESEVEVLRRSKVESRKSGETAMR